MSAPSELHYPADGERFIKACQGKIIGIQLRIGDFGMASSGLFRSDAGGQVRIYAKNNTDLLCLFHINDIVEGRLFLSTGISTGIIYLSSTAPLRYLADMVDEGALELGQG